MREVDGSLRRNTVVQLAHHHSLDAGMGPDEHRLGALLRAQEGARRAGDLFVLMNHPDVHREQLLTLIGHADLTSTWCCTAAQAARWTRGVHYGAEWDGPTLTLRAPAPHPVNVQVQARGVAPGMLTLDAGATRLPIESAAR